MRPSSGGSSRISNWLEPAWARRRSRPQARRPAPCRALRRRAGGRRWLTARPHWRARGRNSAGRASVCTGRTVWAFGDAEISVPATTADASPWRTVGDGGRAICSRRCAGISALGRRRLCGAGMPPVARSMYVARAALLARAAFGFRRGAGFAVACSLRLRRSAVWFAGRGQHKLGARLGGPDSRRPPAHLRCRRGIAGYDGDCGGDGVPAAAGCGAGWQLRCAGVGTLAAAIVRCWCRLVSRDDFAGGCDA